MSLEESFDSARSWVASNLPVAVGGAVAAVVLTYLCIRAAFRRPSLDPSKLVTSGRTAAAQSAARVNLSE
jgi:hypothetical protein